MTTITEADVEEAALAWLVADLGWGVASNLAIRRYGRLQSDAP